MCQIASSAPRPVSTTTPAASTPAAQDTKASTAPARNPDGFEAPKAKAPVNLNGDGGLFPSEWANTGSGGGGAMGIDPTAK